MSIEYYYQYIDRSVVDPLLRLKGGEFIKRYAPSEERWHELLDYYEGRQVRLSSHARRKRLSWLMVRSRPQFGFLNALIYGLPEIKRRCPEIWPGGSFEEVGFLFSAATYGFFEKRISSATLSTVFVLHGWAPIDQWLRLPKERAAYLDEELLKHIYPAKPMFPWQRGDFLDGGHGSLTIRETRRFLRFLESAWAENWETPWLIDECRIFARRPSKNRLRFRDFPLARKFIRFGSPLSSGRPCLYRCFD